MDQIERVRKYSIDCGEKTAAGPMNQYDLLTQHLREAHEAAKPLLDMDDGGTANHDTLILRLPGWREKEIKIAAKEAGFWAHAAYQYGTRVIMFSHPIGCQGSARTGYAEVLKEEMKKRGYDAQVWYQMD